VSSEQREGFAWHEVETEMAMGLASRWVAVPRQPAALCKPFFLCDTVRRKRTHV